jgi:hypothetical protein
MPSDDVAVSRPVWHSTAWLIGRGGFEPIGGERGCFDWPPDLTPGFRATIWDGEVLDNNDEGHLVRHRIDFTCEPIGRSIRDIADEALGQIADLLAFQLQSPISVHIESFSRAPLPAPGAPYVGVSFGRSVMAPGPRVQLGGVFMSSGPGATPGGPVATTVAHLRSLAVPAAISTARLAGTRDPILREAVERSLRWQRRALLEREPIVAFAHYMFALEAIGMCLPGHSKEQQAGRLQRFAMTVVQVPRVSWARVRSLRNELFHGQVSHCYDSVESAAWCAEMSGVVLVLALRHLLGLDPTVAPDVPRLNLGGVRNVTMEGTCIRTEPPSRLR